MKTEPARTSKWGKVVKVSLILLTVLASIGGIAYAHTDLGEAAGSYNKNFQAAVQAKLPMTAEDMNDLYRVPSDENGGPEALSALLEIKKYYMQMGNGEVPEKAPLAVWKPLQSSFEKLEQASFKKFLIFPRDFRSDSNDCPEYTPLLKWGNLIATRCSVAVKTGDQDLAHRLIVFCARMAILAQDNLDLVPINIRFSLANRTAKQIGVMLGLRGTEKGWRNIADEALAILDKPYDPLPMIRFYHFRALRLVDGFMDRKTGSDPDLFSQIKYMKFVPRFERANRSRIHDYFSRCVLEYPKNPYDFAAINRHFENLENTKWDNNVSYMVAGFCSMGFPSIGKGMAQETAKRNVLMQACKVLAGGHDLRSGLPLKGRYAIDVDGKSLRLVKRTKGWILYSIGGDGVDDGGNDDPKKPKDFVVHLPMEVK